MAALAIALAVAALGSDVLHARAQAREPTRRELRRATALFEQSAIAYREARWDAAVALLWEAHSLSREPVLLYNLGRAYDGAGDHACALDAYRRYLAEAPRDEYATAARARVEELEEQAHADERSAPGEGRSPTADVVARTDAVGTSRGEDTGSVRSTAVASGSDAERAAPALGSSVVVASGSDAERAAPWALAGGGGLALAAGAVLAGLAFDRRDVAAREETQAAAVATYADAETLSIAADVLFVAGGALALTGIAWGIGDLASGEGASRSESTIVVALGAGTISVRGTLE